MSIELKQVAEQSLDLSTPTVREMVTRHAAVIDSRATLEDMPEALAFQIDMARALLREFATIQQADTHQPATTEPVVSRNPFASRCYTMSESHLSGHRLIVGFEKLGDVQDAHEWVARQVRGDFTHPAQSVPDDVVLDRYDAGILNDFGGGNVEWWQDYIRAELGHAHDFYQSQIDAAMLAAKEGGAA